MPPNRLDSWPLNAVDRTLRANTSREVREVDFGLRARLMVCGTCPSSTARPAAAQISGRRLAT